MTDPKGEKPQSDHPHEEEFPLDMFQDQEGVPAADEENPLEAAPMNASVEEFQFSGPAEELDFTEPTDFAFPTGQPTEGAIGSEPTTDFAAAEPAPTEQFFGPVQGFPGESPLPEAIAAEPELAGDGIADLEAAEEPPEGEEKPKFELPGWVKVLEWVMVGVLALGALAAIVVCVVWLESAERVALILNIACPVMLALIPYALWRSSGRWVTPAASAVYTVMLALSVAALIAGTWLMGLELSRDYQHHGYDWQFTKTRVAAAKSRLAAIAPVVQPVTSNEPEPAAPKSTAEPAAK